MANATRDDFTSDSVFTLHNVQGGSVMDNDSRTKKVQGWSLRSTPNQFWQLQSQGSSGSYLLKNIETQLYLTATGAYNSASLIVSANGTPWRLVDGSVPNSFKLDPVSNPNWMVCLAHGNGKKGNAIWTWYFAPAWNNMMSWHFRSAQGYEQKKEGPPVNGESQEVIDLKRRLEEAESLAANQRKDKDDANARVDEVSSYSDLLKKQLEQVKKKAEDLRRQLEEANREAKDAKRREEVATEQSDDLRRQLEEWKRKATDLQQENGELRQKQDRSSVKQQDFEKQVAEAKTGLAWLEGSSSDGSSRVPPAPSVMQDDGDVQRRELDVKEREQKVGEIEEALARRERELSELEGAQSAKASSEGTRDQASPSPGAGFREAQRDEERTKLQHENTRLAQQLHQAQAQIQHSKNGTTTTSGLGTHLKFGNDHSRFRLSAQANHEFTFLKRLIKAEEYSKPPGRTNS